MTVDRNQLGRASALTVMSTVKPRSVPLLRALFFVGTHVPALLTTLRRLSFIHFARWTILRQLPAGGPGGGPLRLRNTHLFFESNFNGTWSQYIDAFSYVVPKHISAIWRSSHAFPGPVPAQPFKDYISSHEYIAEHYYSAYPDASTTMIVDALHVRRQLDDLRRRAGRMTPEQFDAAWRKFLVTNQRRL
jgi:hypothetical protein